MNDGRPVSASGADAPLTSGRTIRTWARLYDVASWVLSRGRGSAIHRRAVDLARVEQGHHVLDVGCGTGGLALVASAAASAEGEVHGIDASPEMIGVARRKAARRGADIGFHIGLIEDISFPDDRFDRVLSTLVLHHLPDDLKPRALAEIHRVLKPGGLLLIVDFAGEDHSFVGHILGGLFGRGAPPGGQALPELLKEAGFADVTSLDTEYREFAFVRAAVAHAA